ncbi:hypothetical protein WN944_005787 [Citrus x changshan-huyou]|uniref:Protein kinase domain-containing protein n=1 Tax=Citrus x changshan-huyou TaxID=2935761 RepID=A0AAP0MKK6_9ROSI
MSWQKGEPLGSGSFGSVYEGLTEKGERLYDENSMGFWDDQEIGSEKTLRRWRSACNGRRSFHKLTGLDEHIKLQVNYSFYFLIF